LAQTLDLVNILVSTVVSLSRVAFTVLIGKTRTECIHYVGVGEVFGCDQLDAGILPHFFKFNQLVDFWVCLL
jgi:hypothetical protein